MKINRRDFLKLAGVTTYGAVMLKGTSWIKPPLKALAQIEEGEQPTPAGEAWVPSVCFQCDAGCGILVRVVQGRAVKIEGNPLYPTNQGTLCPKGQAGLQVLYDPDRIKFPVRRIGERGSGQWQRITWTEAMQMVVAQLGELRAKGEPHTVVVLGGKYQGHMHDLMARFLKAYGSPNDIAHIYPGADGVLKAHYLSQGISQFLGYDLENTNYLLSFGAAFAEAWRPTVEVLKAYGHLRQGRPGFRAKIVQIEPRLSVSAAKADEWIPLNPGTDAALALGIARVIITEGLYNQVFVGNNTFGFEDWTDQRGNYHEGFKSLTIREYAPDFVSYVTGVPQETIVRLAREFAAHQPSLAVAHRGVAGHSNGLYSLLAVHSLNALMGNFGIPGGISPRTSPPFAPLTEVKRDSIAGQGLTMPRVDFAGTSQFPLATNISSTVADSILAENPYKVNALFLYYTNPLFSRPNVGKFYEGLDRVPFVVSFSPFLDESSERADLILPDSTYLERLQDVVVLSRDGLPVLGMRQPVVEPLYDTANTGDVILRLAQGLGGTVAESFPWNSFEELLKQAISGIYEAQRGSIVVSTFADFWDKLLKKGGWWDTESNLGSEGLFTTPSGKFEFYSQILQRYLENIAQAEAQRKGSAVDTEMEGLLVGLKTEARGDKVFLPHFEPPRFAGEASEYPFYLNTFKTMTHAQGRGANQPWLQEIYGLHVNEEWEGWAEINPGTARDWGISEGDEIWIESPVGRIKARAKLYLGAMPYVINLPFEFGHKAYGRWAKDRGENPNWIIADNYDYLAGTIAWSGTRVRIRKA